MSEPGEPRPTVRRGDDGGTGGRRVVVTGATGNLGSSLLWRLVDDPQVTEVVALARRPPPDAPASVEWHRADVRGPELRTLFDGADAVVHLAWLIQPTRDVAHLWDVNVAGSAEVIAAAEAAGVGALVVASSVGVYSPGPSSGEPIDESWPTHGIATSAYSVAKAYVERMLDAFEARSDTTRVVRVRPALMFKAENASHVRREFLGSLVPGRLVQPRTVPVVPTLPGVRFQVVHTDDAARAVHLAVTREVTGAFNLAADPVLDLDDVADVLGARRVRVPPRVARPFVDLTWRVRLHPADVGWFDLAWRSPVMAADRARRELGFTPQVDARAALRELLAGLARGAGADTPPLTPDPETSRVRELSDRQGGREMRP